MRVGYFLLLFGFVFSACSISSHLDSDPRYVKDDLNKYKRVDSIPGNLSASTEKFLFTSTMQGNPEEVKTRNNTDQASVVSNSTDKKLPKVSKPTPASQVELMTLREEEVLKEALQKEVEKIKEVKRSDNIIHTNSINLGQTNSGRLLAIVLAVGGILTLGIGVASMGSAKKLIVLIGAVLFISGMIFLFELFP